MTTTMATPGKATASSPALAASQIPTSTLNTASAKVCDPAAMLQCVQVTAPTPPNLITNMLPSAISAVLVVAGWFVVNKAQGNRERRKQIREYVANLCKDLATLEALAIEYHTSARAEAKEQQIISNLGRFEKACGLLPRFLESQKYWYKAVPPVKLKVDSHRIQVMRKAMTLDHFGDEHIVALGHQDEFIAALKLAMEEVQESLEAVRINALD